MSFYFLYFFCIFLRKTTRIKWCRTVFFIFCKYTRIFTLFSLLMIFLVFWAFWSLLPWLASIKFSLGRLVTFKYASSTFGNNHSQNNGKQLYNQEKETVPIIRRITWSDSTTAHSCWCRIFNFDLWRGFFSDHLDTCAVHTVHRTSNHKRWKIRFVTRTKSDFSVIYNHFVWMDPRHKSLFW